MPLTTDAVNQRTKRSISRIVSAEDFLRDISTDPDAERRLGLQECKICFYTQRICGQGFTEYSCLHCLASQIWHNTCTPRLCLTCAKRHGLCIRCAGDIDLKQRTPVGDTELV